MQVMGRIELTVADAEYVGQAPWVIAGHIVEIEREIRALLGRLLNAPVIDAGEIEAERIVIDVEELPAQSVELDPRGRQPELHRIGIFPHAGFVNRDRTDLDRVGRRHVPLLSSPATNEPVRLVPFQPPCKFEPRRRSMARPSQKNRRHNIGSRIATSGTKAVIGV
jgi:hypothetical protein